jgi:DNA mismatch endonuclease (patch repair protein)
LADVFDKTKRSIIMRNIKSKGNKSTEMSLIGIFREQGIKGWRRGYPVTGHPDFVFLSKHVAVFVDGCFWHGHNCRNTCPKENEDFWSKKIRGNIERDIAITKKFENRGWKVVRIWECELKKKNRPALLEKLRDALK